MFGKNQIVGEKYFRDAAVDQLFITSRFMTLQGEGPKAGLPAFFLRFAKCNLQCPFCDAFFDDGDWLTFEQIQNIIKEEINSYFEKDIPEYAKHFNFGLVITGGEPMLQKNIGPFLEKMNKVFAWTQIESNGTLVQDIPDSTILVVSPKCNEKGGFNHGYLKPRDEMLKRANCLKFVMSADPNSPYSGIPDWAHTWAKESGNDIFISPMNIYNEAPQKSLEARINRNRLEIDDRSTIDEVISFWTPGLLDLEANQRNHEYAAKFCIKYGYRYNLQAHLYAGLA